MTIASPPPSQPHPDNCPDCAHVHLGATNCFHSTARDNLCLCKKPQEGRSMKDNGKDVVDVPAPEHKGRSRKPKQEHLPGQEPQPKSGRTGISHAVHDRMMKIEAK